jgi:nitroimidazol reductase NimA-like FMN-containing flavoprotein (pyridoxamine 5'-phosphate oxidase superfamily)
VAVAMSKEERQAFLADVHVGVLSVEQPPQAPLTVPVWYSYQPGGTVNVITGGQSAKGLCIAAAGRFSLCVQTETPPYKYVTVQGPVTSTDDEVDPDERRTMAHRYLGPEFGDLYLQATTEQETGSMTIRMTPQTWHTVDFAKQFG